MSRADNLNALRPELEAELERLKGTIGDDYRADHEDTEPSMYVTLGINDDASGYALQTGDNSFTGVVYGFPHWGVGALYRESDAASLAEDLIRQCDDLAPDEEVAS